MNPSRYYQLHQNLIKKAIEELYYEELLRVKVTEDGSYKLDINNSISYRFKAISGSWDNIHITSECIQKLIDDNEVSNFTIGDFFYEIQEVCQMDDETLVRYLEESNQTLYSDSIVDENLKDLNFKELLKKNYTSIDQLLPGHPKLIMNKGRIGWSLTDIDNYSPERRARFKLRWIAVRKTICQIGIDQKIAQNYLDRDGRQLKEKIDNNQYQLMSVHPWQWNNYIATQFLEEIMRKDIIDLGEGSINYSPQASLRTLSNRDARERHSYDTKVSLSILNTSCVRGIPGKYIREGYKISRRLEELIQADELLCHQLDILKEVAAVKVSKPSFERAELGSYRYKELLGCVWRESVEAKTSEAEMAIPVAGLLLENEESSFVKELIINSKLGAEQWLKDYTRVVILSLYRLQVEHGLGLVAHGQNTILVMENSRPSRLIIKDFHGDLRISTNSKHLDDESFKVLDRLPEEYLIHDLLTGHFITVLRYLSRIMNFNGLLSEEHFYKIIANEIMQYHLEWGEPQNKVNLLRDRIEKVLVNRVRFSAGYSETSTRLKPLLGREIENPLKKYLEVRI